MTNLKHPYLLFLGQDNNELAIKTARGISYWRPDICIAEYAMAECKITLGLQRKTPKEAFNAGARTFVIGLANAGGEIAPEWVPAILDAIEAGLDIASGLHQKLSDFPEIKAAAKRKNILLHDIRHQQKSSIIGTGTKRGGNRILTIGTDCSVGKMYTSLAIEKEMKTRGYNATFRATGQTGIFIAGEGAPVDAVVSDFISGTVEQLCPDNNHDHWDIIEGQGSLFNPAFAGVSLGLLHGAQADILILCHEAGRETIKGMNDYPIPGLKDCIETNLKMARLTNPETRLGAISLNCRMTGPEFAHEYCRKLSDEFSVPCFDPLIQGVGEFVDGLEL